MRSKFALFTLIGMVAASGGTASAQDILEDDRWHSGWDHMASDGLVMLFGWGLLIILAFVLVRYAMRSSDSTPAVPTHRSPLDVLAERFARGEIDEAEYESRRRVLSGTA